MEQLKQALKEGNITFGTKATLRKLKVGAVKNVILSSNCPKETKEEIEHYAKLATAEVNQIDQPDSEIGMICKKRFSVSVLSY